MTKITAIVLGMTFATASLTLAAQATPAPAPAATTAPAAKKHVKKAKKTSKSVVAPAAVAPTK